MKRVGYITAAILTAFLTLLLMYTCRLQETVQLWKHYNIIYISSEYNEELIFDLFPDNQVEGVIAKENSLFSVKNHMLPTLVPYDNEGFTSESMRSFFFKDKSDSYFLFYVPEENLDKAVSVLNKEKIPFGIDAASEYPVLCPILCFAAFFLLMFINRIDFIKTLCLLPLIAVSYAVPFYSVASTVCCFLFAFIIIDLYDGRKGALKVLCRKFAVYFALAAGMTAAALSGKKAFILCLAGLFSSCILLFLYRLSIKDSKTRQHFTPVYIITAPWINSKKRYNLKTLSTMAVFCVCFLILSQFSGILQVGTNTKDLLLPSPSGYTENEGFTASAYKELSDLHGINREPDLTDFLNEKWYAETAAYRKVNSSYKTAEAGEDILLPYFEEEEGRIVEKDKVLFSFDDDWLASKTEEYTHSDGIEKLLVSEDGFFETGYASTGKIETSAFIFPATAICAICFLLLTALYLIKRHKK